MTSQTVENTFSALRDQTLRMTDSFAGRLFVAERPLDILADAGRSFSALAVDFGRDVDTLVRGTYKALNQPAPKAPRTTKAKRRSRSR